MKSRNLVGQVQIVGNDGIGDALSAVKSGQMYATNAESPFALGQEVVRIAGEVAAGNDVNKEQVLQGRIVVKDDVPGFCDYLTGLGDATTCK
ncbi:ABC-type sugar transport system substrate-binding protein [Paeniglutamicibacter sulfureus]|uniref:ABC-type sugar transport system substrate-binding protein n=1 Tax=Paeniglutamicibacter sulfureus TaxID=43666 RepID=A0ABU2BLD6_9MICC|nr:ABC-type sugar transport system substrate-binding protein [Paeniglutamicibacter sulfureus]